MSDFRFKCDFGGEALEPCSFADKYLYTTFSGIDQSGLAVAIKNSATIIPWAGSLHLLMIGLIGGAIFMSDARALGFGLRTTSASDMYRRMFPFLMVSTGLLIFSGSVLALGEMMRLLFSPPFWVKMFALVGALLFTFTARKNAFLNDGQLSMADKGLGAFAVLMALLAFLIMSNSIALVAMLALIGVLAAAFFLAGKTDELRPDATVRLVAAISIGLWLTTAVAGRWIAFY